MSVTQPSTAKDLEAEYPRDDATVVSAVTVRAVVIGLLMSMGICIWLSYSTYIGKSSTMAVAHMPVAALLPLIGLALGVNALLRRFRIATPLRRSELLVIFFMVLTASAVPGWSFASYLVALIGTPLYYATPENRWAEVFFEYLPDWLVATNQGGAMTAFFEGLPVGSAIPWEVWIPPLLWWASFFMALFLVCACLMIILRKQWVEYEKLAFPLAQVPLLLTSEHEEGNRLPPIIRNRLFIAGACLPLTVIIWNIFSYFDFVMPIPIGKQFSSGLTLAEGFPPIPMHINWLVLGFGFFANIDLLLSIWVFRLISVIQEGVLAQVGFNLSNPKGGISSVTAAQHTGGFFFFVLWGLWMARAHLKDVCRKAFGRAPEVNDSEELLTYRRALIGIVIGLVYILTWLNRAGMELWIAVILLLFMFILYLGVTRIVAETGLPLLDFPLNAHDFTISLVGSSNLAPSSLTAMGLANGFVRNWRTFGMTAMAHMARVSEDIKGEKRKILGVMILSLGISMITSVIYTIYLGYTTIGAAQFGGWGFTTGNRMFYDTIVRWISSSTSLGSDHLGFLGFGAAVMWALIQLRYHFPGWPLHPVGFAIASSFATNQIVCSVFVAWLVKLLLLKVGGTMLYKRTQPFFLGILVGFSIGVALVFAVDYVWFPGQGHEIDSW